MNVYRFDLNLHWKPIRGIVLTIDRLALGDLDDDITLGSVAGVPVRIGDDSGFTYNVGLGAAT